MSEDKKKRKEDKLKLINEISMRIKFEIGILEEKEYLNREEAESKMARQIGIDITTLDNILNNHNKVKSKPLFRAVVRLIPEQKRPKYFKHIAYCYSLSDEKQKEIENDLEIKIRQKTQVEIETEDTSLMRTVKNKLTELMNIDGISIKISSVVVAFISLFWRTKKANAESTINNVPLDSNIQAIIKPPIIQTLQAMAIPSLIFTSIIVIVYFVFSGLPEKQRSNISENKAIQDNMLFEQNEQTIEEKEHESNQVVKIDKNDNKIEVQKGEPRIEAEVVVLNPMEDLYSENFTENIATRINEDHFLLHSKTYGHPMFLKIKNIGTDVLQIHNIKYSRKNIKCTFFNKRDYLIYPQNTRYFECNVYSDKTDHNTDTIEIESNDPINKVISIDFRWESSKEESMFWRSTINSSFLKYCSGEQKQLAMTQTYNCNAFNFCFGFNEVENISPILLKFRQNEENVYVFKLKTNGNKYILFYSIILNSSYCTYALSRYVKHLFYNKINNKIIILNRSESYDDLLYNEQNWEINNDIINKFHGNLLMVGSFDGYGYNGKYLLKDGNNNIVNEWSAEPLRGSNINFSMEYDDIEKKNSCKDGHKLLNLPDEGNTLYSKELLFYFNKGTNFNRDHNSIGHNNYIPIFYKIEIKPDGKSSKFFYIRTEPQVANSIFNKKTKKEYRNVHGYMSVYFFGDKSPLNNLILCKSKNNGVFFVDRHINLDSKICDQIIDGKILPSKQSAKEIAQYLNSANNLKNSDVFFGRYDDKYNMSGRFYLSKCDANISGTWTAVPFSPYDSDTIKYKIRK